MANADHFYDELFVLDVVGVALAWTGAPGPLSLDIVGVRAAIGGSGRSGYAVGTLAALDPGAPAAEAMIAVGDPVGDAPGSARSALRGALDAAREPLRWAAANGVRTTNSLYTGPRNAIVTVDIAANLSRKYSVLCRHCAATSRRPSLPINDR